MYQFKEITLKNKSIERKVLVIEFEKKEMAIVSEFLMTDASMLNYEVIDLIDQVLTNKKELVKFSGNRIALTIEKEQTNVADLFAELYSDVNTLPSYDINTEELRKLILIWKRENEKYK